MEHNNIQEAPNLSESQGGESSSDEYQSEYDSSDCSITSGREEDDDLHNAIIPFSETQALDAEILQVDESANTTWTDDKHSSYLDSIEATFVRKMYDKEYCSLDVCGHSSQSSMTWELECVESHPYCLNMRMPHEQPVGPLPLRNSVRPWLSTSSMLASPWIQHFKAKQVPSAKNSDAQEHSTKIQAPNLSASTENLQKPTSTMCDTISNTASLKISISVLKKRAALFDSSDCMQSGVNSKNSNGTIACGFKKLKCQQSLSQMDMVMEEQYNIEQQNKENTYLDQQNEGKVPAKVTIEELRTLQTGIFEADESRKSTEVPQLMFLKEKQAKAMCIQMGLGTSMLSKELSLEKSDQVVPSFKDCCKEAGEQSIIQDKAMPSKEVDNMCRPSGHVSIVEEIGSSFHSSEEENASTQLGSKTWIWGTQGLRYQLGGTMSPANFKH